MFFTARDDLTNMHNHLQVWFVSWHCWVALLVLDY